MGQTIPHPEGGIREKEKDLIVVTGSSGLIGSALIKKLAPNYRIVGLDRAGEPYPPLEAECVSMDLTDLDSIDSAFERIRYGYGNHISSVVHLAAYYNFTQRSHPAYDAINVQGTQKLLDELQDFKVDQFIYSSSDLIYKPVKPGQKISEDSPVKPKWGYPKSKVDAEKVIEAHRKNIPSVIMRIAGLYDDYGHSIPVCQQIKRIHQQEFISHFYSGELEHGDVFIHLEDVLDAIVNAIEQRKNLPDALTVNIGEPETPGYKELQDKIGELLHGKEWQTFELPKPLAKSGAWVRDIFDDPFIKPWMIDRADDHYELDISKADKHLGWQPRHRLMATLPKIVEALKEDPERWYEENGLDA